MSQHRLRLSVITNFFLLFKGVQINNIQKLISFILY